MITEMAWKVLFRRRVMALKRAGSGLHANPINRVLILTKRNAGALIQGVSKKELY